MNSNNNLDYFNQRIENMVEIKRTGRAPKGEYCSRCIYLRTTIDREYNITGHCNFFGDRLSSIKVKAPCGEEFDEYNKCLCCRLQEIIKGE